MCKIDEQKYYMLSTLMSVLTYHTWSGNEAIMQPFLLNELKILGFDAKTDSVGNIYAVRGKAEKYPLLNAHMDIIYSLSTKAKTKIQAQMKKDKPVEPEYSYKDIIQCANCSFLEACIDLVMKEANIKEQQAYWRLKWSKGCGMYIFDNEGYNKMLYALYDKEYDPTKKPTFCYYSDCSYSYISEKEKPDYDKYLNEMYQIKFDDKSGKITGDESRVLGGDDKCGIALALATAHALPELPMKLLFTVGEEKGCIGAKEFCDKNKKWFADCKYSITIDRRGGDNLLRWSAGKQNCSTRFAAQLAMFGVLSDIPIKVESGTIADVICIREHVKETVNISAGYYNPHTTEEWVDFFEMCKILDWLKRIVTNAKT